MGKPDSLKQRNQGEQTAEPERDKVDRQCNRLNFINLYTLDINNESKIISQVKMGYLIAEKYLT